MDSAFGVLERKSKELKMPKFFKDINLARDKRVMEKEAKETQRKGVFLWACDRNGTRLCVLDPYRRDKRYFDTEVKEWQQYTGKDRDSLRIYMLNGEILQEIDLEMALSLMGDCISEIQRCEWEWH